MRVWLWIVLVLGLVIADPAAASMILGSSLGTSHVGNLVANGSFETGAPPSGTANHLNWASGTTLTPFGVPPGWSSSGGPSSYAVWGNDATLPQSLRGSDALPDGNAAMYFGNGAPVLVNQPPTFQTNGTVTFPSPPTMTTFFSPVPVILEQTVNTPATPAPSYIFSFWVSGEDAVGSGQFAERGIFGLQVTNVLPGDPIQYLAVPYGLGPYGASHLFEFTFAPLNAALPVDIRFINWGHFDLSPYGVPNLTTELVLDDVIVNAVPEPGTFALLAAGLCGISIRRRSACRR